jgi:hypothetical protein
LGRRARPCLGEGLAGHQGGVEGRAVVGDEGGQLDAQEPGQGRADLAGGVAAEEAADLVDDQANAVAGDAELAELLPGGDEVELAARPGRGLEPRRGGCAGTGTNGVGSGLDRWDTTPRCVDGCGRTCLSWASKIKRAIMKKGLSALRVNSDKEMVQSAIECKQGV